MEKLSHLERIDLDIRELERMIARHIDAPRESRLVLEKLELALNDLRRVRAVIVVEAAEA
jgi:hypothetical protein